MENEDRCAPVLCVSIYRDAFGRVMDYFSIRRWREINCLRAGYEPRAIARRIFTLARNDAIILTKSLAFTAFGDVVVRGRWGRLGRKIEASRTSVPAA
jgi:hypothetical protein